MRDNAGVALAVGEGSDSCGCDDLRIHEDIWLAAGVVIRNVTYLLHVY